METILRVENLSGGYLLNKPYLKNLSFEVGKGEMIGLIGLNGAGKSTAIKHILGLLKPQKGHIEVQGQQLSAAPAEYRQAFTYVPETPELYEELTIEEHLALTARVYGLTEQTFNIRCEALLKQFAMLDKRRALPSQLSKGMRQKAMIMNAFIVQPPLYIIDEPFVGLDPLSMRSLLDTMLSFKEKGASFLISSHILSTIEKYCDRFIILHRGSIIAQGSLTELTASIGLSNASLDDVFYAYLQKEEL